MNVYVVSYTSYNEHNKELSNKVMATHNRINAIQLYDEFKSEAMNDAMGKDEEYDTVQVEKSVSSIGNRKYHVERVDYECGFQATVELEKF